MASGISFACALIVITPLGLVLGYLILKGASSLNLAFFFNLPAPVGETGGGVANAIVGTFIVIGLASVIGVPVGVLRRDLPDGIRRTALQRRGAPGCGHPQRRAFHRVGHRGVRAAGQS